jgi:hypothetical protein
VAESGYWREISHVKKGLHYIGAFGINRSRFIPVGVVEELYSAGGGDQHLMIQWGTEKRLSQQVMATVAGGRIREYLTGGSASSSLLVAANLA